MIRLDQAKLTALVDELVEAHLDTLEMALPLSGDPAWSSHVRYLQALNRAAEAMLARSTPLVTELER